MQLTVNGDKLTVPEEVTLTELLTQLVWRESRLP